jgi:hypothetical protein
MNNRAYLAMSQRNHSLATKAARQIATSWLFAPLEVQVWAWLLRNEFEKA